MTINSVSLIFEERSLPSPGPEEQSQKLHPAPDFPFKGWQPPQTDGYRQSAGTPLDSAIVIDNGT
jgi:actin-related protein 5